MTKDELLQLVGRAAREGRTALNLASQKLRTLPPEIGQLTQLQWLHLSDNELSSLPPEVGQLTQLRSLDLGDNRLGSLPPEIGRLTRLQSLDVGENRLSSLPPEIGQLTNLKSLNLMGNRLGTLPPEIGQLTQLQALHLWRNQLSSLPPEIGQLVHLQALHLWSNQLSSLPPEIGQLTNLKSLYVGDNELGGMPAEITRLTQLQSLDLGDNRLSTLPPEIGRLTKLQSLHLSGNRLGSLPPEIGWLTKLQSLYLVDNQLSALPPEIGQLTQLQEVNLSNNWLDSLPAEIGQLTQLYWLALSENQLSALPPEIGQLAQLQELHLFSNQLTSLPPEIGRLIQLQSLYLGGNELNDLPPEIGRLTRLQSLSLWGNRLSGLPPEITHLAQLQLLDLAQNQLRGLPSEITRLTQLQSLDLARNQLRGLPPETTCLTQLQLLDLSENQFSSLPPEIGQLVHLQALGLRNNRLSALPPEIGQLMHLQWLNLSNNQLNGLPPEIQTLERPGMILDLRGNPLPIPPELLESKEARNSPADIHAILDFYFQAVNPDEAEPLREAKLLIVGEGGAGKTSLAKKLQDERYELKPDEASTRGIEVLRWEFPQAKDQAFLVNIWDFGGQEIYHATHQFFLTKRSLYALVADTRKGDTDFYYWLKAVELLSDNSPVLIVKNEKDDRPFEINERQLKGEFSNLKEVLATNLATNRGLREVKQTIQDRITHLPHVGTPLPKTWVRLRAALENYAAARHHLSAEEYYSLCRVNHIHERSEMLRLSGYLHDLGVCLHFQEDPLLKHTLILTPAWATTAVYRVLDTPKVREGLGRFTREDLKETWTGEYADKVDELLQLMKRFKLCYEIPGLPDTYLAPHLLSTNQPAYGWADAENLQLRYEYDFMPKGILTRFIVEMHRFVEQQTLVWRAGVVLNNGESRAEVIEYYRPQKGEIRIRASGIRKRDFLTVVGHELDKIHATYERLNYKKLIPCNCPTCQANQIPHFYPLEVLHKFLDHRQYQIQCQNSFDMVDVRRLIDEVILPRPDHVPHWKGALGEGAPGPERQREGWPNQYPPGYTEGNAIFLSYAWGGESESLANQIDLAFRQKGVTIVRDKQEVGFKGSIKGFMERIGRGKCVIVILSEKYLKSENCMFELLQVAKHQRFNNRIFPIVLEDARIYRPIERIQYVRYWEEQLRDLDEALKSVSAANMEGFREDIDLYTEIRRYLPNLTNILKDMNNLTAKIHQKSGFEALFKAIEQKLSE
jgi:internalin A